MYRCKRLKKLGTWAYSYRKCHFAFDTRVVEGMIKMSIVDDDSINQRFDLRFLGYIGLDEQCIAAAVFNELDSFLDFQLIHIGDVDLRAAFAIGDSRRSADSVTATGYEDNFACKFM